MLIGFADSLNTLDTALPIARLSPVRGMELDDFGYSVAAHKFVMQVPKDLLSHYHTTM